VGIIHAATLPSREKQPEATVCRRGSNQRIPFYLIQTSSSSLQGPLLPFLKLEGLRLRNVGELRAHKITGKRGMRGNSANDRRRVLGVPRPGLSSLRRSQRKRRCSRLATTLVQNVGREKKVGIESRRRNSPNCLTISFILQCSSAASFSYQMMN
jgi:hypothetical protein